MFEDLIRYVDTLNDFRHRLHQLRTDIENAGYSLRCEWRDEYGGVQSVVLGHSDELKLEESQRKSKKCPVMFISI